MMPKNLDSPIEWTFLILTIMVILIGYIIARDSAESLDDPDNKSIIYLEELPGVALLSGTGDFRVYVFRQSGNVHNNYDVIGASEAISKSMSTFRRAGIDAIHISENSDDTLCFSRLIYSHRGSSEGKKVGSVRITRIS